jgi:5-methylcytosine-specific restriction protein A
MSDDSRKANDQRRHVEQPWRAWYRTKRWKATRAHQFKVEPNCRTCTRLGRVTPATVCDHVEPHRGDEFRFWSGPFQSLCDTHHSQDKQRAERGRPISAIGADGWPDT